MEKVFLKSPAKLNLSLDIIKKTDDGYHLLKMITQIIDLFDNIEISKSKSKKINIYSSGIEIPLKQPEDNIIYKTTLKFFEETNILSTGVDIKILKNIPVQAGLGGGSSNAATTLVGLNNLFQTGLSKNKLQKIGKTLGADVPLFLEECGTLLCEGIGEIITPLSNLTGVYFVIIKPEIGFSTAQVYNSFDKTDIKKRPDTDKIIKAISESNILAAHKSLYNVLEEAIDCQEIFDIKKQLYNNSAVVANMTGSGSAVFGIFKDKITAQNAFDNLNKLYSNVYLCKPIKSYY